MSLPKCPSSRVLGIFLEAGLKKKSQVLSQNDFPKLISQQHRLSGLAGPRLVDRSVWGRTDSSSNSGSASHRKVSLVQSVPWSPRGLCARTESPQPHPQASPVTKLTGFLSGSQLPYL